MYKLYKDAQQKVVALHDINLSVEKGEYLTILGPSGAGKSTLMHILAGLELPSKGKVSFKGKDLNSLKKSQLLAFRNRKVGFVFQFYHLIEELTVLENILLPVKLSLNITSSQLKEKTKKAIDICSLLDLKERIGFYPSQISGGEQQRTALARALINDPEILFCDEPTGNLDSDSSQKIRNLLTKINKENHTTIIMVTHNLELAKDSQRVLNIKKGKLVESAEEG